MGDQAKASEGRPIKCNAVSLWNTKMQPILVESGKQLEFLAGPAPDRGTLIVIREIDGATTLQCTIDSGTAARMAMMLNHAALESEGLTAPAPDA